MIEGALISCGIMISYWIDFGMAYAPGSVAWRFPLAFQIFFCLFILAFVMSLPESPRWLILKGRSDEARDVISAIADKDDEHDRYVENELAAMQESTAEMSKGSWSDLFSCNKNRNLHRTLIAYTNQMMQQICRLDGFLI
jgi:hypothetical protein